MHSSWRNDKMTHTNANITDVDRRRLGTLVSSEEGRAWGTLEAVGELEALLEDASPIDAEETPEDLVTMNSTVAIEDVESGARRRVTLVYPQDAEDVPNAASVVEPAGLSLIGCHVGDVVQFPDETGHDFRITDILYQPEKAGAYHL
jgi:regulator of nucleoside diphosphate kinase